MSDTLFSLLMEKMHRDTEYLREINDASHPPLKDIDEACRILHDLKTQRKKLVIYPDIDVDGLTAGSLGLAGFAELGFDVALYIPNAAKGHGVYSEDIDTIITQHPDVAAVITCDTGITSFPGIQRARDKGLVTLVTDHHKEFLSEHGERLPADIIINPHRIDETYPHSDICGAFVLYQVLGEYALRYANNKLDAIRLLKLYAGIGTIADMMPVTYENRDVIRSSVGLLKLFYQEMIEEWDPQTRVTTRQVPDLDTSLMMRLILNGNHHPTYIRAFRGIAAIVAAYTEQGKITSRDSLDEGFTGYYIAPLINAIRRMREDIGIGFSAFIGSDPLRHAQYLLDVNNRRKETQKEALVELMGSTQPLAPYIYRIDSVETGMLGLLANNMMKMTGVPTLVIAQRHDGTFGGSGRSPQWYPFNTKLNEFGYTAMGHEHAFGVTLGTWDDVTHAYEIISADTENVAETLRRQGHVIDTPEADLVLGDHPHADAPLDDLESLIDLADQLTMLKPYGQGFREPVIDIVTNLIDLTWTTMGSSQQHVSLVTPAGMKMVSWNNDTTIPRIHKLLDEMEQNASVSVLIHALGDVKRNEWNNKVSANLIAETIYAEVLIDGYPSRKVIL